jgi:phage terminase small subunit
MAKKPGRKAAAQLTVAVVAGDISFAPAPSSLDASAAKLWDSIVCRFEQDHFNSADLALLSEFCHTAATLLPRVNKQLEDGPTDSGLRSRSLLVKEAQSLATKLRLCVSSRTRGDLASIRDAGKKTRKPWEG